ncbi:hypothetical protein [Burkholderia cenocepacia]|uniref:hypothetical protein n=1 Tax=Burkholderia cenocepacia TaxID=95486 RepID=UPI002AB64976|nr:hypothetical protein [Burkholderia cenocepacia]
MIVVRTLSTVGGVRPTRRYTRRLDRAARARGYRNAKAWALAIIEKQLRAQALANDIRPRGKSLLADLMLEAA